jgi:hypothetical protein
VGQGYWRPCVYSFRQLKWDFTMRSDADGVNQTQQDSTNRLLK